MKTSFKMLLVCTLVLGLIPAAVNGQVNLLSPPNGAVLSDPPSFSWAGPYDAWLFFSVFYYDIVGVYTGYFPVSFWLLDTGFPMPDASWWDLIGEAEPNFWAVLGVDQATGANSVSEVWTFTKGLGCDGNCCGEFTLDCNPGTSCACFTTTEGDGVCVDDFTCSSVPSCGTTADCGAGTVCITCSCCSGNRCVPNVCSGGGFSLTEGTDTGGMTGTGQ